MTNPELIRKLKHLRRKWLKDSKEFEFNKRMERKIGDENSLLTAARYEGEAVAFRWCAEDLEKLL